MAKWLGFTPNNKASGGKVLSKKTLKNKSDLPNTFRMVANAIGNIKKQIRLQTSLKKLLTNQAELKLSLLPLEKWLLLFTK